MTKEPTVENTSASSAIVFDGRVQKVGDRAILRFPDKTSAQLPSRGQVAVKAVLNGHSFETVVEPDGMRGHWLPIENSLVDLLALDANDPVTLEVEPTKDWPEPELPDDFRAALLEAPDIAEEWRTITSMARWEWVRWINATKNPQTRARRVAVSISKLRSGKRRPCCFDLSSCTDPELSKSGKLAGA
ncbi:YdeI/OmpD-associated family protein [Hoyosella altamirensis]|uniref:DUF1905 domain-containing protein n=1 Tax=Hoyosella altamirensis TaxID=616997 RepID=A0A839RHT4_9ACTN|nr:YdeI/OmpD-associated family protein [Hoyosella altamirensis]MBB3035726.1 hypothetical protein [Hoyosella altamirensis]